MAKFCTQCGAKLDDDDLFCGVCGVSLMEQNVTPPSEPASEEPEYEQIVEPVVAAQSHKKKSGLIAVFAAVAVVAVLLICLLPKGTKPIDNDLGSATNTPVVDDGTNEFPEVDTPDTSIVSTWGQAYTGILADAVTEFPQHQYSCSYSVFDIDKDGTPELFLKVGTCEADYQLKLYRYANGTADCFATLSAGHAVFCGLGKQQAFLIASGHQGYEVVTKYSYDNGKLNEEILFEDAVQNYHEFSYLTSFELDDLSGLEWTANEPDNNQSVLDNYSLEDNVIAEAEITSDNFEQVVPLNKRSEWYDNGIFSSYFASCDHQSNVTWEYIGTTSDIFGLSYYDYTEVDVFRVDFPDGWKTYLFVPYNENIGNPPVVFLFFDSNEVPMEIWNGSY